MNISLTPELEGAVKAKVSELWDPVPKTGDRT